MDRQVWTNNNPAHREEFSKQRRWSRKTQHFLLEAEGSEGPFNSWRCLYYLSRTAKGDLWAIDEVILPEPGEDESASSAETIALMAREKDDTVEFAANALLRAWVLACRVHGGRRIQAVRHYGEVPIHDETFGR